MTFNLTQPRLVDNISTVPSDLELLPVETRYIVYHYLFGDLETTFHIRIVHLKAYTYEQHDLLYAQLKRRELEQRYGVPQCASHMRPQLKAAKALLLVNNLTRNEVARLVYPNLLLETYNDHVLLKLLEGFTPLAKQLIRSLSFKLPGRLLPERARLCCGLVMMTGLQDLRLSYCDRPADPAIKGTAWAPGTLQCLKFIRKALPHLNHLHYIPPDRGSYVEVHLTSIPPADASATILDIDTEYQKWLDANKQRRLAKKTRPDKEEDAAGSTNLEADV